MRKALKVSSSDETSWTSFDMDFMYASSHRSMISTWSEKCTAVARKDGESRAASYVCVSFYVPFCCLSLAVGIGRFKGR
jgi:hypothetical protein